MPERLTRREVECVQLAGAGLEDKEIAARLGLSPRTVGNHLHRAYQKLGVSDRRLAAHRLSSDYSPSSLLIPASPTFGPDGPANGGESFPSESGRTKTRRSLYERYVALGEWRSPPRIFGSRLVLIVILALLATVVLGLIALGLRLAFEVVDIVHAWRI